MENYTIQTQQERKRMKGWIGELRPNWPMFSLRLVISLVARLVIAGYGTARVFHLRAMHIATLNAPFDIPQFAKAKLPCEYACALNHSHSQVVTNATVSTADGRSEILPTLPPGGSCGPTGHSHLVHANSSSRPLYSRGGALLCTCQPNVNRSQMRDFSPRRL
jgi:hypothetical protein